VLESEGVVTGSLAVNRTALLVLAAGAALLLLAVLWRALRGVRLRGLGPLLLRGAALLGAVCLAILVLGLFVRPGPVGELDLPPAPPPPVARTPLGQPPSPVLWIAAGTLALASALAVGALLRPRRPERDPLLVRLGLEAERARTALASGEDARGVILACYARMGAALAEGRGVERPASMTAREFGEELGEMGLPRSPVRELTALFEAVRYGRRAPTPAEEARAVACLDPIVEACRGPRPEGTR
jgi:hypothetical protein